jgi:hypothetical protein
VQNESQRFFNRSFWVGLVGGFVAGGLLVGTLAWFVLMATMMPFIGPGWQDYSYDLSGGYRLERTAAHQETISPIGSSQGHPAIGPKIVGLAWDGEFILAERQALGPNKEPVDDHFDYWILEARSSHLLGPMTVEEFDRKRAELSVPARLRLRDPSWYR